MLRKRKEAPSVRLGLLESENGERPIWFMTGRVEQWSAPEIVVEEIPGAGRRVGDVSVAGDGTEVVVDEIATQRIGVDTHGQGRWNQTRQPFVQCCHWVQDCWPFGSSSNAALSSTAFDAASTFPTATTHSLLLFEKLHGFAFDPGAPARTTRPLLDTHHFFMVHNLQNKQI